MFSKEDRTLDLPAQGQHGYFNTDHQNPPWGTVPEVPFDRNTEDIRASDPYRLVKSTTRSISEASRRAVLPSKSLLGRSGDSIARDTDSDGKSPFGKDHWEKQIQRMDSTHIAKAYRARSDCLKQQKLVATERLKVHTLRASMREQREEEANLRDSIGRHLSSIACCTCKASAQLIEKDYEALRSMVRSYLDLEYVHDQAEDELEEQEQELSRSAARLIYISYLGVNTDTVEGSKSKGPVRKSKADLQGPNPSPTSPAKFESSSTLFSPQSHTSKSQLQGPGILGEDKYHDPVTQIGEGVTTAGPSDLLPGLDEAAIKSCGDLPSLDQILEDVLGPSSDTAQYSGRLRRAEYVCGKNPFKLAPGERFSPFDPGDSVESPSQRRGRFINNWILHQLRSSSLESSRLRSRPEWQSMREQGFDDTDISRLALERWHSDDTGTVASGERTIIPSLRSKGCKTAIWRGIGGPSYRRKRTRSVAFAPVPPLRRMSRHDTAWDEVYPEGQSSQDFRRPF
ncbi:uncharacterized protein BO80DRAFT_430369 [Aspergillus ibericus CBS 121593]|uniref:Uncharacterized protein n=1 Tax=Aspergillus ibericus CBS 121593 TaxID=1448316 RepID=A0A395GHI6_9EURO|nr:hypothetical protein BO80DRAFT_430369 [Aspergillus ibericus CBS 121593]RAK94865.1 hypothetical protein BO80DRAFT_430369 [Aspergillus ibericus CBS 121593]